MTKTFSQLLISTNENLLVLGTNFVNKKCGTNYISSKIIKKQETRKDSYRNLHEGNIGTINVENLRPRDLQRPWSRLGHHYSHIGLQHFSVSIPRAYTHCKHEDDVASSD